MSSFGFRQPQFSEELAYLPIWLQNPQLGASPSDSGRDAQTASSSGRELKSLSILRDSIGCENVVNNSSREEGRYKDCYLFLSGDGNSESSVAQSPGNLLHLSLYISLDADSTSTHSQLLYSSNPDRSSKFPSQHQVENLSRWDTKACPLEMDNNVGGVALPSLASTPAVAKCESIQLPSNKQNRGIQGEANSNVPPAIMEPARPMLSKSGTHGEGKFSGNQIEDADIDGAVELSIAASEALVIHELMKVESNSDGLEMGSILEAALRVKQARVEDLEDGSYRYDDIDELDFLSDLDDSAMGDALLDVGISVSGSHVSGSDVSHVKGTPTVGEKDDDHVNGTKLDKNHREENVSLKETQEADGNGGEKKLTRKSIAKYFIDETSFISESADIAVNQVSCMQRKQHPISIPSQSSINFNGLGDTAREGVFPSQEVRCSYASASDPLCSVIPCSIPLEDVSPANQNEDNAEVEAQNCFSHKSIIQCSGEPLSQSLSIDDQAASTAGDEHYAPPVRRQLGTLKNYSKVCLDTDPILEGERTTPKMFHQFVASTGKEREGLNSDKDCSSDSEEEQVQDSPLNRDVVDDMENCEKSHCEPGKDESFLCVQSSIPRSPIVLNRTRHRLQARDLSGNNVSAARCLEQDLPANSKFNQSESPQNMQSENGLPCTGNLVRKRVHFSVETQHDQSKGLLLKSDMTVRDHKRSKLSKPRSGSPGSNVTKKCILLGHKIDFKNVIFHRMEFLITGFSSAKERELGETLQKFGGIVLSDIPPHRSSNCKGIIRSITQQLPVIICSRKLQTSKFLYGCAVNASILKAKWITDSIAGGNIAPPERYLVLPNQADTRLTRMVSMNQNNRHRIFDRVGIMIHGKPSFCRKLSLIIKHGGGEVFQTLQKLLWGLDKGKLKRGVIVAEDQSRALRHLQHCAEEHKIALMSANWIVKSLHLGKLLPTPGEMGASPDSLDWSQEI